LGLSANALAAYRRDIAEFAAFLGSTYLLEATTADIIRWLARCTKNEDDPTDTRPWGLRTAHRKRSAVGRFYTWAQQTHGLATNPADDVELARFFTPAPIVIRRPDIQTLFSYIQNRIALADPKEYSILVLDLAVFRLMDRLALRVTEASHLRISHFREVDGELHVLIRKKGRKNKVYPLVGAVRASIEHWMRLRRSITPVVGHEDYLFIHPRTGYRIHRGRAWKRLQKLATLAGLDSAVILALSPHKLRHARARHMLDAGRTLAQVKSVLDHASISTTSIYLDEDERARLDTLRDESDRE